MIQSWHLRTYPLKAGGVSESETFDISLFDSLLKQQESKYGKCSICTEIIAAVSSNLGRTMETVVVIARIKTIITTIAGTV